MSSITQSREALTMTFDELWAETQILKEENEIEEEDYEKIKNGIKIKFPITWITQEWYELYPNTKRMKLYGHGKYNLTEFMEEKEQRETLMRRNIIKNIEQAPTKPRIT